MISIYGDKIAVVPMFDADETPGGIIIPDQSKERCDQGIVKYMGPDVDTENCKIGDHVVFSGYTGTLLKVEGEGLLIVLPYEFIVAILHRVDCSVPGLFFQSNDGEYFPATYEMAMNIIAQGISESPEYKKIEVRVPLPLRKDYEKWR